MNPPLSHLGVWLFFRLCLLALFTPHGYAASGTPTTNSEAPVSCPAVLKHSFNRLQDEAPQDLCQYAGNAILVVNTASYCGFTSQYEGLEALYRQYKDKGLVVLGFPSNDFGKQEPGTDKEIADFCYNTYAVKFPMFSKSTVRGDGQNECLVRRTSQSDRANPAMEFSQIPDRPQRQGCAQL
jgi:glutathione peroxidase